MHCKVYASLIKICWHTELAVGESAEGICNYNGRIECEMRRNFKKYPVYEEEMN
jgi:hypothetical protein